MHNWCDNPGRIWGFYSTKCVVGIWERRINVLWSMSLIWVNKTQKQSPQKIDLIIFFPHRSLLNCCYLFRLISNFGVWCRLFIVIGSNFMHVCCKQNINDLVNYISIFWAKTTTTECNYSPQIYKIMLVTAYISSQ